MQNELLISVGGDQLSQRFKLSSHVGLGLDDGLERG